MFDKIIPNLVQEETKKSILENKLFILDVLYHNKYGAKLLNFSYNQYGRVNEKDKFDLLLDKLVSNNYIQKQQNNYKQLKNSINFIEQDLIDTINSLNEEDIDREIKKYSNFNFKCKNYLSEQDFS